MNIELLAGMIRKLILEQDEVALPGLGVFVAEEMEAVFSDKGFTVNPPYRRLAFRQKESTDNSLVELYAIEKSISQADSAILINGFLKDLGAALKEKKSIFLPGLGHLRATRQNHFFFVQDEYSAIFPQGFGLQSISLKSLSATRTAPSLKPVAEAQAAAAPEVVTQPEVATEAEAEVPSEPGTAAEPETVVQQPEAVTETAAVVPSEPEYDAVPVPEAEPEQMKEQETILESGTETEPEPMKESEPGLELESETEQESAPSAVAPAASIPAKAPVAVRKKKRPFLTLLLVLLILAVLFFAAVAVIGRVAPQVIDPYLYTPEQLELLNY